MGKHDDSASMPNPSETPICLPTPSPIAITSGTVTGPVVTPPESHAIFKNVSSEKSDSINKMIYGGASKYIRSILNIILRIPKDIPIPTPIATA